MKCEHVWGPALYGLDPPFCRCTLCGCASRYMTASESFKAWRMMLNEGVE